MDLGDLSNRNIHRKDQAFKGAETLWGDFVLSSKTVLHLIAAITGFQLILVVFLNVLSMPRAWGALIGYISSSIAEFEFPYMAGSYFIRIMSHNLWLLLITAPVWLLYPLAIRIYKKRAAAQAAPEYEGGAKEITEDELIKQIKKSGEKTRLHYGRVPIPISAEVKHAFIVGRPGVGKTVAVSGIIDDLQKGDQKLVVYDFKGDYLSRFYRPDRDLIFNPLDTRTVGWTIFNEMTTFTDVDAIAASLIPPTISNQDPFWADAARDVFAGILFYLYQQGKTTNKDVWEAVTADKKQVAEWLKSTRGGERGYTYISDASSKQALAVFSVLMQYVKSFEYMAECDGPFCVKNWLSDGKPGTLFVTNYADIKDTLKPILSLMIDLMGRRLLSMSEDPNRRVFFLIDEFGTLQRLSTIINLLTLSRSKGGSCTLAIQDIGQSWKIYGPELTQSIFNACGLDLFFSVSDPDTAEFLSRAVGDTRFTHSEETRTIRSDEEDSITMMRRRTTEKLVLGADFRLLPDLTAYIKVPNFDAMAKIKLQYKSYGGGESTESGGLKEPFIMKPGFELSKIKEAIEKEKAEEAAAAAQAQQALKGKLKGKKEPTQTKEQVPEQSKDGKGEDLEGDTFFAGQ